MSGAKFLGNPPMWSYKSDVWQFGILMWKVFTCLADLYVEVPEDQVPRAVLQGMRLRKPLGCPDDVYEIMRVRGGGGGRVCRSGKVLRALDGGFRLSLVTERFVGVYT